MARLGNFTIARFEGDYDLLGSQIRVPGQIVVESIRRFKGQQAPAVIVTDIDSAAGGQDRHRRLLYAAMTRATVRLDLLVNGSNPLNGALIGAGARIGQTA